MAGYSNSEQLYYKLNSYFQQYNLSFNAKRGKVIPREFFRVSQIQIEKGRKTTTIMDQAIDRANRIHEMKRQTARSEADWESVTTVYELVRALRPYIR